MKQEKLIWRWRARLQRLGARYRSNTKRAEFALYDRKNVSGECVRAEEITEKLRPRAGLMRWIKFINSAKHELPRERKVVKGGKKLLYTARTRSQPAGASLN